MAEADPAPTGRPDLAAIISTAAETFAATALALYVSLYTGSSLVWLLLPLAILGTARRSLSEHGFDLRLRPPPLGTHLTLGAFLLSSYALIHAAFALATGLRPVPPRITLGILGSLVEEFLIVGIPEEAFFRGYVQTRWNRVLGTPWRVAGARVGPALLVQSVVFAICHLATGDWTRLRVLFFALLAGWLRDRSGSILGPAVYHAVANVWFRLLVSAFR